MLQMNAKQLMAVLLSLLLVHPLPMTAGSGVANSPRTVLGSINSRGLVRVGNVPVPGMSTLFAGDEVRTETGSALIQYRQGARVVLGGGTEASFTTQRVELQKGQMSFDTSAGGPAFAASTLRLEPASAKSAANVTLGNRQAAVAVTEGAVNVVDPSGALLASLTAGEARLFEEAPAAASPAPAAAAPAAAAAAPQGGLSGNRAWLIALGVGIVGTSLGIAGLVRANDASDRADEAEARASAANTAATAAASQVTALQATVTALNTQLTTLRSQLTALQASINASNPLLSQLSAALAQVNTLQSQLLSAQTQLNTLLVSIAAQGGVATPAQLSQLQSLGSLLSALFQQVQSAVTAANNLANQLRGVLSPV